MKKLLLIPVLVIFSCSGGDDSSDDNDNNNNNNSGLINCDGNSVPTIVYGTQEWTAENACHTTYRDGTPIPQVTDGDEWLSLTTGAWCYYDNNPNKGILYNWYAVMGIHDTDPNTPNKEFATDGWQVPSYEQWTSLTEYLISNGYNYDGTTTADLTAKSMASTSGWNSSTNEGVPGNVQSLNNDSGFNAYPFGMRGATGNGPMAETVFGAEGYSALFWHSTEYDTLKAYNILLYYDYDGLFNNDYANKQVGLSVRLVKD